MDSSFKETYGIVDTSKLASPSLLIYPKFVKSNLNKITASIDISRLRPHIKTIKSAQLIQMQLDAGIFKFKCATIKEAALLLELGAKDILIAYPMVAFQMDQMLQMMRGNPEVKLQGIIDHIDAAELMNQKAAKLGIKVPLLIDVNLGMGRTGVEISELQNFYDKLSGLKNVDIIGFHGYDGHVREVDLKTRREVVDRYFRDFLKVLEQLEKKAKGELTCVFGGSNTFPIYKNYPFIECSPGTFMLWDWGYHLSLPEQHFDFAAILFTRVISKPTYRHICLDLGYKAIASENPIGERFYIPEHPNWIPKFQSEEHLVMQVPPEDWDAVQIGVQVYVVPYHICPSVAWYPYFKVVENGRVSGTWPIAARY